MNRVIDRLNKTPTVRNQAADPARQRVNQDGIAKYQVCATLASPLDLVSDTNL
jgi:hypothetical protein